MEALAQLEEIYFLFKVGSCDHGALIDWAIERLQRNEEGDDLEVVLLAAATERAEALPLAERIIERYRGSDSLDEQLAAGKYVASLHRAYLQRAETVHSLEAKLSSLYNYLGYPDWLVMLTRNCEYATDIPAFKEPFEREFEYVAGLWQSATTRAEFEAKYSRDVSNQHDAQYC